MSHKNVEKSIVPLVDQYQRTISYLRISLTDRCNLRCMYCMPEDENGNHTSTGVILDHFDLLSYEEILHFARIATELGVTKIRLTGGEPLVRRGVLPFIEKLMELPGLEQVVLTTNGALLPEKAQALWDAGVRQLNISLDTFDPQKFKEITKRDVFDRVWEGIHKALQLGFRIKLNVVAMKGINSDEFLDFGRLALKEKIEVRFIEFMPMGEQSTWREDRFISGKEIMESLKVLGELEPLEKAASSGPARMFRIKAADGRTGLVGFINPLSHHFCDKCNRLRLTSEGKLRACLLHDSERDVKKVLREGGSDADIAEIIRKTVHAKPKGHCIEQDGPSDKEKCRGQMSQIGG